MYRVSNYLIQFCKNWEEFRERAYMPTPDDEPTIGYGTTHYADGHPVQMGDTITEGNADFLLEQRLESLLNELIGSVSFSFDSSQTQEFEATVSLCDNIGLSKFLSSVSGHMFTTGSDISERFALWNEQAGQVLEGLVKRRAAEKNIYNNGDYSGCP